MELRFQYWLKFTAKSKGFHNYNKNKCRKENNYFKSYKLEFQCIFTKNYEKKFK